MDKKRKIIIAVVMVLLLLSAGAAFGVFFIMNQKSDGTSDDTVPQYVLQATPNSAVEEGNLLSINLTTSNVLDNPTYYYQITGVQQADFSSGQISDTSGLQESDFPLNFELVDEKPVLTSGATGGSTESSGEMLKFNLYSDSAFTNLLTDITVTINDSGRRTIDLEIQNVIQVISFDPIVRYSYWKVTGRDRRGLVEDDVGRTHNRTPAIRVKRGDILKFTYVGPSYNLNITYKLQSGFNNHGNFPETYVFEYLQDNGGTFTEVTDATGISLGTITWNTENAVTGIYYYNNSDEFSDPYYNQDNSLPSGQIEITD